MLNRTEVAGSGDTVALGDRFANLDYNRNGVIGRDEWHWSRAHFDRLDADRDGQISRGEYRGFGEDVGNRDVGNRMVQVNSTQRWTDTGLDVRAGNTIRFQADGTIQLSDNPSDTAGPAGAHSGRRAPNAPVLQAPAGGLIVRIGNSEPIFVGANGTIGRAPANGRLYLGVNDDHLPDNSGQYRVTVDIER